MFSPAYIKIIPLGVDNQKLEYTNTGIRVYLKNCKTVTQDRSPNKFDSD